MFRRLIFAPMLAAMMFAASSFVPAETPQVSAAPKSEPCCQPINFVQDKAKHPRGHKAAPKEVRDNLHAEAFKRNGHRVMALPKATAASFDCRTAPGFVVLGADDQGPCGDCFGVSSADVCSMALAKAGVLPASEAGRLSSQYGLDNPRAFVGGCNGGDEAEVINFIFTNGFPLTKDYGPYSASPGRLKSITNMPVYKIGGWGYCTPSQQEGVAKTQDMKNCIAQYGPISVAFDAGECDDYTWPAIMVGAGQNVDHAVICIGWDDAHDNGDGSKGAFLGMNQWGQAAATTVTFASQAWGGPNGTFWIKYGADSFGTEAIWVTASTPPAPAPVPPTPTPVPPTPTPTPPAPVTPPTWWEKLIAELENELWFQNWLEKKTGERMKKQAVPQKLPAPSSEIRYQDMPTYYEPTRRFHLLHRRGY